MTSPKSVLRQFLNNNVTLKYIVFTTSYWMHDMEILAKRNDFRVMEISKSAYAPLLLMLFSVFSVVGDRPENTFMLFWIKKHMDHFCQLEITTKKQEKKVKQSFTLEFPFKDNI